MTTPTKAPEKKDLGNAAAVAAIAKMNEALKNAPKVNVPMKTAKDLVHEKLVKILAEYGNKESEIPLNHEYWDLNNQHRALRNP